MCVLGKAVQLSVSLFLHPMKGIIMVLTDKVGVRIESANACKVLSARYILSVQ